MLNVPVEVFPAAWVNRTMSESSKDRLPPPGRKMPPSSATENRISVSLFTARPSMVRLP